MLTQVLYRRWRPQLFEDIVGQGPITQTLRNAVAQQRIAHAYLLCGPRGTGKTSIARILAKALNCESLINLNTEISTYPEGEPDNTCEFCTAANEGRAFDIIEIDAASNRGIEDIRSLRERVFGAGPAAGRCKVYIIDEVHMLTPEAFNALLKTLEEPSPWAYFILCTTEAHKLPPTIISRCQRFDLRRISTNDVVNRLQTICQSEGIEPEPEVLQIIARASWGSLRDACNILDQTVTSFGSVIKRTQIEELLGLERTTQALDLIWHAVHGDVNQALKTISRIADEGIDVQGFHRDILVYLRAILLTKGGIPQTSEFPEEIATYLMETADRTSWDSIVTLLQSYAKISLRNGDTSDTLPLELALIEAVQKNQKSLLLENRTALHPISSESVLTSHTFIGENQTEELPQHNSINDSNGPQVPINYEHSSVNQIDPEARKTIESNSRIPVPTPAPPTTENDNKATAPSSLNELQWNLFCRELRRATGARFNLGSLLLDCRSHSITGDKLTLVFRTKANMERLKEELDYPPSRKMLQDALLSSVGKNFDLTLVVQEHQAEQPQASGHLIRAAMAMGAKIIPEKERPE